MKGRREVSEKGMEDPESEILNRTSRLYWSQEQGNMTRTPDVGISVLGPV